VVALVALAIGAWLGLRVSPPDVNQGDLIRVMYAHVSVAWVSFLAVGVAAFAGIAFLWTGRRRFDVVSVAASEAALLFGALTIIGGMTYSKPTLNTFWTWDAKLTLTALMVALLAGVFIVRGLIDEPVRRGRVSAVILIVVLASLPLNYLAAEWFRTLHPAKSIDLTGGGVTMDSTMLQVLLVNVGAAALMFAWMLIERVRLGLHEAESEDRRGRGGEQAEVVRV
jgi:heme exporter protein C